MPVTNSESLEPPPALTPSTVSFFRGKNHKNYVTVEYCHLVDKHSYISWQRAARFPWCHLLLVQLLAVIKHRWPVDSSTMMAWGCWQTKADICVKFIEWMMLFITSASRHIKCTLCKECDRWKLQLLRRLPLPKVHTHFSWRKAFAHVGDRCLLCAGKRVDAWWKTRHITLFTYFPTSGNVVRPNGQFEWTELDWCPSAGMMAAEMNAGQTQCEPCSGNQH